MSNVRPLAHTVGRRQKRLHYWEQWLQKTACESNNSTEKAADTSSNDQGCCGCSCKQSAPEERKSSRLDDSSERLSTYRLLISKLAKATTPEELLEVETRLAVLDRELTALFESRRLLTEDIGLAAVGD